jgi:hypothetical protein
MTRLLRDERFDKRSDFTLVELTIGKAGAHQLPRKLSDLLVDLHEAKCRAASS